MLPLLIAAAGALLILGGGKKKKSSGSGTTRTEADGGRTKTWQDKLDKMMSEGNGPRNGAGTKTWQDKMRKMIPEGGSAGSGTPWERCLPPQGSPKGTYAAYSEDGKSCMVFWKPDSRAVVISFLQQEFDKLSKSEQTDLCSADNCEPDQFAMDPELFCEWVSNPDRAAFVKRVVLDMFPQIPANVLPPPEPDGFGRVDAPYFLRIVWSFTEAAFAHDFCGFNPVT